MPGQDSRKKLGPPARARGPRRPPTAIAPGRRRPMRVARERPSGRPAPKVRPALHGPVQIEIVSVGRDLLRGRIADSNAQAIAGALSRTGGLVRRITIVDDELGALAGAIAEALARSPNLLILSAGLGPAGDDRTLAAVARTLGRPLVMHSAARALVEAAYEKLARARVIRSAGLNAAREKLCLLPVGSIVVPNPEGLAPGAICRLPGGAAIVCLPGQPREMLAVLDAALPLIRDVAPKAHVGEAEIEAPTPDESSLWALIERVGEEFPEVWISSRPPPGPHRGAIITLEAAGATPEEAAETVAAAERRILDLVAGAL